MHLWTHDLFSVKYVSNGLSINMFSFARYKMSSKLIKACRDVIITFYSPNSSKSSVVETTGEINGSKSLDKSLGKDFCGKV